MSTSYNNPVNLGNQIIPEVFISSRYTPHALIPRQLLISELQRQNIPVWDGVIKSNQDILRVVTTRIDATPLAVVLATNDYAEDTKVLGNTLSEIRLLKQLHDDEDIKKPFVYIKMCKKFKFTIAKTMLPDETIFDYEWLPDTVSGEFGPPPQDLIDLIIQKYKEVASEIISATNSSSTDSLIATPALSTVFETSQDEYDDGDNDESNLSTLPFQDSYIPYSAPLKLNLAINTNTKSADRGPDMIRSSSLHLNLSPSDTTSIKESDKCMSIDTAYRPGSGKFMHVLSPENRPRNRSKSGSEAPRPVSFRVTISGDDTVTESPTVEQFEPLINSSPRNRNCSRVDGTSTSIDLTRRFTCDTADSDYERFHDTEESRARLLARGRYYKNIGCFTGKMPSPRYGDNFTDKTEYCNRRAARVNEASSTIRKVLKSEPVCESESSDWDRSENNGSNESSTKISSIPSSSSIESNIQNTVISSGMVTQRKALFESKVKFRNNKHLSSPSYDTRSLLLVNAIQSVETSNSHDYRKSALTVLLKQNIEKRSINLKLSSDSTSTRQPKITVQALRLKSSALRQVSADIFSINSTSATKICSESDAAATATTVDENCRNSSNSIRESE